MKQLPLSAVSLDETSEVERLFASAWNRRALYLALFLFAALIRLAAFTGISLTDDIWYSRYAQLISQGIFSPDSGHVGLRVGVTVPVGILYRLFGVSEWTTILVPLVASSLSVPLLVAVGRRLFPMPAALLAGLLLATLPTHVTYATILVPEPILEFYLLTGVLLYLEAGRRSDNTTLAVLAGLCFGIAYLAKEVALFVGAAFVLWSILRGRWRFAVATAVGMGAIGALEMAVYLVQTGDPMFRSHAIARSQELYFANVGGSSPLEWRLFKAYPYMMLLPSREFAYHSLISISLAIAGLYFLRGDKPWMLLVWAAIPMLYLNFGSSSLSDYAPVAVAERYIGVVYYPLFLLAGVLFTRWLSQPRALQAVVWGSLSILILGAAAGEVAGQASSFTSTEETVLRATLIFGPLILLALTIVLSRLSVPNWPRHTLLAIVALVILAGFLGSLASRNMQTFSEEMTALKAILERAQEGSFQIVRFEGERGWRWRFAMEMMRGLKLSATECSERCLVIRPDASGLPYATVAPGARPEDPLPLKSTFLPYE